MESIVQVLESVMATRDPYTVSHQQRMAQLSLAIAREMEFEEKKTRNITIAARLHDFGKISVPIGILAKPGKLSVLEMAMIKSPPHDGLRNVETAGAALEHISHHYAASRKDKWVRLSFWFVRRRYPAGSKNSGGSRCGGCHVFSSAL